MKSQGLWMTVAFFGLTAIVALAIAFPKKPFEAYGGRPFFHGEGTAFRYTGQESDNGDILVTVSVNIDDPEALRAYKEANDTRVRALIARGEAQSIWVQVTFRRPLPPAHVRTLVKETGFRVDNFLMVGHTPNGEKMSIILNFPIGDDFPETLAKTLSWEEIERLVLDQGYVPPATISDPMTPATLEGIMLLQGIVEATEQGLGRWLANEDVYLIDTTALEVHELITRRHANLVDNKEIVVTLPSPF
ncbi:MAG: hypothetical protein ACK4WM_07985 [Thermoflexales bacterium]